MSADELSSGDEARNTGNIAYPPGDAVKSDPAQRAAHSEPGKCIFI
jgi:hypothetical protein